MQSKMCDIEFLRSTGANMWKNERSEWGWLMLSRNLEICSESSFAPIWCGDRTLPGYFTLRGVPEHNEYFNHMDKYFNHTIIRDNSIL